PWAAGPAGPLFAGAGGADAERLAGAADALFERLSGREALRIDWHLGERDFDPAGRARLLGVVQRARSGAPVGLVFDRPRRPVALAEGLDRDHPAVLLAVGVSLPELARQPGAIGDPARFRTLLASVAG